ncbi:MAG: AAA family ATPase [Raoultibacter sp.]
MELKRKVYARLLEWKRTSNGSTALFVDGARRVGKSYVCKRFAENEYESHMIIDFGKLPAQVRDIFENDSGDIDMLLLRLAAFYRANLVERKSLIVFDEVQLYPKARQLIKYLVADGRYDYLETGSLVTLRRNAEDILIPSEEEHVDMFPLDFEEFLWALGDDATYPALRTFFEKRLPLGQALHRRIMNDFRLYLLVGGMPQVVEKYLETKDFEQADRAKRLILDLYRSDVTKFAKGYEARILSIFDGIPSQLSKKEKRYKLSSLRKAARFRDYEDAFVWLDESMVVNTCLNATDPTSFLAASADSTTQKLYLGDTGLLVALTLQDRAFADSELYRDILLDKLQFNEGMLAENVVAQMLRPNHPRLYFYSKSDTNNRKNMMEIDFLVSGIKKPFPIEVKSGRYRPHTSLDKFTARFGKRIEQPIILYTKDIMEADGILHLPLYMAGLL